MPALVSLGGQQQSTCEALHRCRKKWSWAPKKIKIAEDDCLLQSWHLLLLDMDAPLLVYFRIFFVIRGFLYFLHFLPPPQFIFVFLITTMPGLLLVDVNAFFNFLLHFQPLCPVTDFYFCSILCWESCFWLILLVNWFFIVFVDFFRLPSISQTQGVTVIFSNQSVGLNFNLELSLFIILQGWCFVPFQDFLNAHCHFLNFL